MQIPNLEKYEKEKIIEIDNFSNDAFSKKISSLLPENETVQNYIENALMQPNEISRASYGMTLTELKTFSYLIKAFKEENRDSNNRCFIFNFKELLEDTNISYSGAGKKAYIETIKNLMNKTIYIENEKKFVGINIFEKTDFDKETNMVSFWFTETFAKILERKDGGKFTLLNFEEMINLDSFYAIRFYQFAMSFKGFKGKFKKPKNEWFDKNIKDSKNTWLYGYSINQLKFLFGISDKYKGDNKGFLTKVIEKPFQELSEKIKDFDFKYQIIKKTEKANSKIEGIIFWTTEKKSPSKNSENLSLVNSINKSANNLNFYEQPKKVSTSEIQLNEIKPIFDMQEKYPEEFRKRFQEEKIRNPPFSIDIVLRKNVYDSMIADGFQI